MSDYGKRGGTSKNAGKKATTWVATTADGTMVKKRSFHVDPDRPVWIAVYQHEGKWYTATVTNDVYQDGDVLRPDYGRGFNSGQIAIPAVQA